MSKIKALPVHVANQIAAGEVIERPASVLKELLENSCDAKATQINIEIKQAGKRLIQVFDNGCGIDKDELPLALAPHATSKITVAQDLEGVETLGFRGEALASISSVSRFSIQSKTALASSAWGISCQGKSELTDIEPVAHPAGTTMKMQDLFYNTPVRRKFLRTDKTESIHLDETIKKVLLSHFDIGFSVTMDDKSAKKYPPCETDAEKMQRVRKLCGSPFVEQSLSIDVIQNGMRLWGWLGLPEYVSRQPDTQYFFVNGRAIRDRVVNHAVRTAYENKIEAGFFPAYVLYLDIDATSVDVNVHPTKHEVRFQESRLVHNFLTEAIESAFEEDKQQYAQAIKVQANNEAVAYKAPAQVTPQVQNRVSNNSFPDYQSIDNFKALFNSAPQLTQEPCFFGEILSVIDERWILTKKSDRVILVDIKSAQQMIALEQLSQQWRTEQTIQSSELEIPECVTVKELMSTYQNNINNLKVLGLVATALGPEDLLIREVPKALPINRLDRLVEQMLTFCQSHPDILSNPEAILRLFEHMSYEATEQEIANKESAKDFLKHLALQLDNEEKNKPYKILGHKELGELFARV